MTAWPYRYRGQVARVVDGDTLRVAADVGLRLTYAMQVRVRGVNAAEHGTTLGDQATAFVRDWVAEHADPDGWIAVTTHKDPEDPHGRWVADVASLDGTHDLAADLIAAGLGAPYDGRGPKPVPVGPPTSYDKGGYLPPAARRAVNMTGSAEVVEPGP